VADLTRFNGRFPDSLSYEERLELDGKWAAFEIYSPERLPLRVLEAVGETPAECRRQLNERGLKLSRFEIVPLKRPF
jgi:hypothetical protein